MTFKNVYLCTQNIKYNENYNKVKNKLPARSSEKSLMFLSDLQYVKVKLPFFNILIIMK